MEAIAAHPQPRRHPSGLLRQRYNRLVTAAEYRLWCEPAFSDCELLVIAEERLRMGPGHHKEHVVEEEPGTVRAEANQRSANQRSALGDARTRCNARVLWRVWLIGTMMKAHAHFRVPSGSRLAAPMAFTGDTSRPKEGREVQAPEELKVGPRADDMRVGHVELPFSGQNHAPAKLHLPRLKEGAWMVMPRTW